MKSFLVITTIVTLIFTLCIEINAIVGECELGCWIDSDCVKGTLCAFKHKPELLALKLNGHKAYCTNIPFAKTDYVCYSPVKAELDACTSASLSYKDGAKCGNAQTDCYDAKSFMCLRFIKKTVSPGKYTCRPRSCLYKKQGGCKSGAWKWRYAAPANHTTNESQCID